MGVPRGQRYELCRSVHAEMNAIIHAARVDMLGSTLYLVGREVASGEYVQNAFPCSMCTRLIINAGISTVTCGTTRKISASSTLPTNGSSTTRRCAEKATTERHKGDSAVNRHNRIDLSGRRRGQPASRSACCSRSRPP